jgi:hypothetical protein
MNNMQTMISASMTLRGICYLSSLTVAQNPTFTVQTYSNGPQGLYGIATADLNGDGKNDPVSANAELYYNGVTVYMNAGSTPTGLSSLEHGTPGCSGILGLKANGPPKVNSPSFLLKATHSPVHSLGLGIATDSPDTASSDSLALAMSISSRQHNSSRWISTAMQAVRRLRPHPFQTVGVWSA